MMKIYKEISLRDFHYSEEAQNTVKYLKDEELDLIDDYLSQLYPEGVTGEQLNSFFFINIEDIAALCGYENWETLFNDRSEKWEELI